MDRSIILRLSAGDRALMNRCAMAPGAPWLSRRVWIAVTHLGGTGPTLLAAGLPWFACCALQQVSRLALASVIASHLLVQLVKRSVGRVRPTGDGCVALVREPDRFSFPSGHATASMSVAVAYAMEFPTWAAAVFILATAVGFSRVRLGVHYPSDVLAGQVIAIATSAAMSALL